MLRIFKFGDAPFSMPADLQSAGAAQDEPRLGVSSMIEQHLAEADSYIVYPHSDPLLTFSLLVAKQYNPEYVRKPVVMFHSEQAPNPYVQLVRTMRENGVVPQEEDTLFHVAAHADDAEQILRAYDSDNVRPQAAANSVETYHAASDAPKAKPAFNVCIIGSYFTKNPEHIELATQIGDMLHRNGWGLVYGGTDKGMMGAFAKASQGEDHRGYVQAVMPKMFMYKGVDAEMHDFIDRMDVASDIYVRLTHMAKQSDIFLAAPGGLGTAQEIAAFLRIKETDPAQAHKPLVLLNEGGFWDPMVKALEQGGYMPGTDFMVAASLAEVEALLHAAQAPANTRAA